MTGATYKQVVTMGDFNYWLADTPRNPTEFVIVAIGELLGPSDFVTAPSRIMGTHLRSYLGPTGHAPVESSEPCVWADHFLLRLRMTPQALPVPQAHTWHLTQNWARVNMEGCRGFLGRCYPQLLPGVESGTNCAS